MKSLAEINKAIASIKTSGAKLDKMIQDTGVAVLEHFAEHKDTGVVNRLYLALPKGARRSAMTSWLLAYGALVVNPEKKAQAEQPFVYDRNKITNAQFASLDMWYDHKPEPIVAEALDLQKAVRAILAKAGKVARLEHGDVNTLKALAKSVGIPESDVPTRPAETAEAAPL